MDKLEISIDTDLSGRRLDTVVCRACPYLSRSRAATLIKEGAVRLNNAVKRPSAKVRTGDRVTALLPDDSPGVPLPGPAALDLDIRHEDDHVVVVNKAAGMVVHPGAGNVENTLVNGLLHHYPPLVHACEDPMRPGIVHRLDKETSGLLVVAKTRDAFDYLKQEFFHHRVEKVYQALVQGGNLPEEGRADQPIGRHPKKRKQMAVDPVNGRKALTHWQVMNRFENACQVRVCLHTGRTHQIRVHFYAMGHPLIGDPVYQFRREMRKNTGSKRQMLHAWQLGFRHPHTREILNFRAEPPGDFQDTLSRLGAPLV